MGGKLGYRFVNLESSAEEERERHILGVYIYGFHTIVEVCAANNISHLLS